MLRIAKKVDGFWLIVETEEKQAMINLGFPENIVGDVLEEAAQQSVNADVMPCGHPLAEAYQGKDGGTYCRICESA